MTEEDLYTLTGHHVMMSQTGGSNDPEYSVVRTIQHKGDSTVITAPKRELRAVGVDIDDLQGQTTQVHIFDDKIEVDIPMD